MPPPRPTPAKAPFRPPERRPGTLYRLRDVEPGHAGMREAISTEKLAKAHATIRDITVADVPAVLVCGDFHDARPSWCLELAAITGVEVVSETHRGGGLLLLSVDGVVYAIGFGAGHRFLADEAKDPRFGLSYVIRDIDSAKVKDIVRRTPGTHGRTDSTYASNTLPISALNLNERAEIVKRLGGEVRGSGTGTANRRATIVEGGIGLRARFPTDADALVAYLRNVSTVCATASPDPALRFIERIQPVTDREVIRALDTRLDTLLGIDDDLSDFLTAVVPASCAAIAHKARSVSITLAGSPRICPEFDLAEIANRANSFRDGRRVAALRDGTFRLHSEPGGRGEVLAAASAIKWLEVELSIGARQYCLHDGDWYELDAAYLDLVAERLDQLIAAPASITLPQWQPGEREAEYNRFAASRHPGFTNMDKELVRTRMYRNNGVEVCDLIGPGLELVHVKKAENSGALSHLFAQGLNAVEHLRSPEGRAGFHAKAVAKGRAIPPAFVPETLVFALLLAPGKTLAESVRPFSRVVLMQTVSTLKARGVNVELIGVAPTS